MTEQTVIDGTAPSLKDCIDIVRLKTEHLRDRMRAKSYADASVSIEVHSDCYSFVKLDTNKERVFSGYSFNWICKRDFDEALAQAEGAIEGMPTNYPSEAYAAWFTIEPVAQEEAAQ